MARGKSSNREHIDPTQTLERYLRDLRAAYPSGEGTEHSGRSALEALLKAFAGEANPRIHVQHEPKQDEQYGAPDFRASRDGMVLGYAETKAVGTDLGRTLKTEQIKRYRQLSGNLLVTNYIDFAWIEGDTVHRASLGHESDLEYLRFRPKEAAVAEVTALLKGFFSAAPLGLSRADDLALALAQRCRLLRDNVGRELVRQQEEGTGGRLLALHGAFRDQVFHELSLEEFADAFAQTLGYGLFLAKFNAESTTVDLYNVERYVPRNFRLIRELTEFLKELEEPRHVDLRWLVEEILSLINGLDLAELKNDLSFANRRVRRGIKARSEEEARLFERDPYIYFYEDFLSAYDASARESRGVYYTPPPVVNFIVRAVDDTLKHAFGIRRGLADHDRVTALDFAAGTGTFLIEVFERAIENAGGAGAGRADRMVREHLLQHVFGFEYLIAPYTIAHLKLSQFLASKGHGLASDERLRIYLTNTLEPIEPQHNMLLPALSAEAEAAQTVKEQPILVITGNPPYSGHSRNMGEWIRTLIETYKYVDGAPLGEQNSKWLHDDYVKFIRFAQHKMDQVEEGIVGVITNHAFLDNPTFRGMRESLLASFHAIYTIDLHGSAKRAQTRDRSVRDENVFDIQQGVAITLFVKNPRAPEPGVWHTHLWGSRLEKYKWLADTSVADVEWTKVEPVSPYYLFVPHAKDIWDRYVHGWPIPRIFPTHVLGFQTHRDKFAIAFTAEEMQGRVNEMRDTSIADDDLRRKYGLRDNRDWQVSAARSALQRLSRPHDKIRPCAYRPFDIRYGYLGYEMMDYPRREILDHVSGLSNICLLVSRQIDGVEWRHAHVTDLPAESCYVSNKTKSQNYVMPLYLHDGGNDRGTASFNFSGSKDDGTCSPPAVVRAM
jgi:hypothetical protein